MKQKFIIEVDIPEKVTIMEIQKYITTAVMFSTEGLSLDDPLYQLDKSSVRVIENICKHENFREDRIMDFSFLICNDCGYQWKA